MVNVRQISQDQFSKGLLKSLNQVKDLILNENVAAFSTERFDTHLAPSDCLRKVSPEELVRLQKMTDRENGFLDPIAQKKFEQRARCGTDANLISFREWLRRCNLWDETAFYKEIVDLIPSPLFSGWYIYPSNGYMGWHTNENKPGGRLYFTYAPSAQKSFFRYIDPISKKMETLWDNEG